ncbi:acetylxylan esterase [Nocardiopsis mangrovi]|uniref:Acetylxylan esterase n=1 Tax=Nocardiopsis mangrovi TaxID=1179818 RepID=A0ABV9DS17_9ACTN
MFVDLPLDRLREFRSEGVCPPGFEDFWTTTLAEARTHPLDVRTHPAATGLRTLDVHDVTFAGFDGAPIKAWLRLPHGAEAPLPAVVEFPGYGSGRGSAVDGLFWASAGFAHLTMDVRGQGGAGRPGDTADPVGSASSHPGFMTRGIEDPGTYYYRRVITDAVRAVEAARALDAVDPARVAVLGRSQGGALALAAGTLVGDVAGIVSLVPFLCDIARAVTITDATPYAEIPRYLRVHRLKAPAALRTLAHIDGVHFAARARVPALFTTALMDATCPPSTVFAARNAYGADRDMVVWPYNGHEGGDTEDQRAALDFLSPLLDGRPVTASGALTVHGG